MNTFQCKRLHLESSKCMILNTMLYHISHDVLMLRCVDNKSTNKILIVSHGSTLGDFHIGGNFAAISISYKILRFGFYWHIIFFNCYKYVRRWKEFKRQMEGKNSMLCLFSLSFLNFLSLNGVYTLWGLLILLHQLTMS